MCSYLIYVILCVAALVLDFFQRCTSDPQPDFKIRIIRFFVGFGLDSDCKKFLNFLDSDSDVPTFYNVVRKEPLREVRKSSGQEQAVLPEF